MIRATQVSVANHALDQYDQEKMKGQVDGQTRIKKNVAFTLSMQNLRINIEDFWVT